MRHHCHDSRDEEGLFKNNSLQNQNQKDFWLSFWHLLTSGLQEVSMMLPRLFATPKVVTSLGS